MSKSEASRQQNVYRICGYGQYEDLLQEIKEGFNFLQKFDQQRTVLHNACIGGHHNVVRLILSSLNEENVIKLLKDVDVNGQTPLHLACINGNIECISSLLNSNAKPNVLDSNGVAPFHYVCRHGHTSDAQALIARSDIDFQIRDSKNRCPLFYACENGDPTLVEMLVKRGCNVNDKDIDGFSPIHIAASFGHLGIVKLLVKSQADVEAENNEGQTIVHLCSQHNKHTTLHWILTNFCSSLINKQDKKQNTALHYACQYGSAKCINCLMQHTADFSIENSLNDTPVFTGKKHGHSRMTEDAITNVIECDACKERNAKEEWDRLHPKTYVEKQLDLTKKSAFTNPVPRASEFKKVPSNHNNKVHIEIAHRKRELRTSDIAKLLSGN